MDKRVVITGMGVISSIGKDREEFTANMFNGVCGITKQNFYDLNGAHEGNVGRIMNLPEEHPFFENNNLTYDRCSHLALIAAEECVKQAALNPKEDPYRIGVVVGTSLGGMLSGDEFHTQWLTQGIDKAEVELLRQYPLHAIADVLALRFGFCGIKAVISTACAAGSNSIGYAADMIRSGKYDFILAGGVDPLSRFSFSGFKSLKALASEQCKPYSQSDGINLGEGAAFFILENYETASKRGADMLAEVRGYALTADAYHQTAPDLGGNGAVRSMRKALENSGLSLNQVSYINGHGTGTTSNDVAETRAVKTVFGELAQSVPMTSIKGAVGHCLGAAGAVEAAASVLSIAQNKIPPTLNFQKSNYEGLSFVPNKTKETPCDVVLSNSFAFGGNNCSVVFSKVDEIATQEETAEEKIVITGIGCTGAGGAGTDELWETFRDAKCWIVESETDGKSYDCRWQGQMPNVKWKKFIPPNMIRRIDQVTKLAMSSGKQALTDAKINVTSKNCEKIGVIFGTSTGPLETIESINASIVKKGIDSTNPFVFPNSVINCAPGNFCIANQLKGPTSTLSSGNNSTINALTYAYELMKNQQADILVVVGADECNDALMTGNDHMDKLSKEGKMPFCEDSDGMVLSPGSTAFVLETEKSAKERGAHIYAEILGYAATSDNAPLCGIGTGNHWKDCVRLSMEESGIENVDFYAASAYGIPEMDRKEAELINSLFGDETKVSCVSPLLGTTSGSIGGYGLLSALYAMQTGTAPAVKGADKPLKLLEGRVFADEAMSRPVETAIVSTAAFGGSYAAVVVKKYGSDMREISSD